MRTAIGAFLPAAIALCGAVAAAAELNEAEKLDYFEKNIRPVLASQCYACHSQKSNVAQGNLYVDSKEGLARGGKSGVPAVVPGRPEESLLLKAMRGDHKDLRMPPGKALPTETVGLFTEWIKMGAPDPRTSTAKWVEATSYDWEKERKHWAYQPVRKPAVPKTRDPEWTRTEIDRFVKAMLDEQGLRPVGKASKRTLLRRVTYDLTGQPPTPEEMKAFLADGSPQAFERVVDRLLATRQYGEHWGRHWLDLVRYADTAGDASDFPVPEMHRYRNWVIRAIHSDRPVDQFLKEQIAGDLLPAKDQEDRRDKVIATSYIAASRRFGQTMSEHYLTVDDTIENFSKSMLGLTAGCARCHDHKFDPIPTKDYYALSGIFESTNYAHAGLEHHQYLLNFVALDPKEQERLDKAQKRMFDLHAIVKKGAGPMTDDPQKKLVFYEAQSELTRLRRDFPNIAMAFAASDGKPVNAKVMVKGDPKTLGPEVPRGFFQILGGQRVPAEHKGSGRDSLAEWLTDPKNPLTTRVFVNRVWLWHFGRGIVNTPNDFGSRGDKPTHPELLDYLAATFQEDGWSLKKLHKRILLSRAWQSASLHNEANSTKDPKNAYYWRFHRRRLSAEELRDSMLALSNQLDPAMPGSHPFPPRGSYTFTQHNPFVADLKTYDHNARSVYLIQQRFRRNPYLELFDGPDPNNTTPARSDNTSALQSLYFFNNEFVHQQADQLAVRIGMAETATAERVRLAYDLMFQRPATPAEVAEASQVIAKLRQSLATSDLPEDRKNRSAWGSYVRVLFASNEFFYLD